MELIIEIFDYIWGIPLTIFIIVAGIYFSSCIKFIQITNIKAILKNTIFKIQDKKNKSYKIILNVLGGTVGAGNVVGVATSIAIGGPGAIFWMWLIALFSMATKMIEVTLAVKHHKKTKDKKYIGGSMYYINTIKGKIGKILSIIYSIALLLYVLCDAGFVQINTVSTSLLEVFNIPLWVIGILLILTSSFILIGGLNRVSKFLEKIVPIMCLFYLISAIIVIIINIKNIPSSIIKILTYAFRPAPIIGGFAGSTIVQTISKGAARGIFANEAGTGTSTTIHATSTNPPVIQGMWGIIEVAIVSFIVCTITALLIMTTNSWTTGLDGAPMVLYSFETIFGNIGKYILCFVIVTFAYSTYIGFFYEYTTCIRYLFKEKYIKYIKFLYLIPILLAVFLPIEIIWSLADIAVGFIVIPNIIALFILRNEFKKLYSESRTIIDGEI